MIRVLGGHSVPKPPPRSRDLERKELSKCGTTATNGTLQVTDYDYKLLITEKTSAVCDVVSAGHLAALAHYSKLRLAQRRLVLRVTQRGPFAGRPVTGRPVRSSDNGSVGRRLDESEAFNFFVKASKYTFSP